MNLYGPTDAIRELSGAEPSRPDNGSSGSPKWLTDLIDATLEWARDCGYRVGRDICLTRVALVSGADHEADYYATT